MPVLVTAPAWLRVFNNRQTAFGAEEIRNLPHDFHRAYGVSELAGAVHIHRAENAMTVGMRLVGMHRHDKLMPVMSEFFHERIADIQRRLRRDLPWFKTLPDMIGKYVAATSTAPGLLLK